MERYDFLVIGGGLAGLSFALKVADLGTVCVLFKKEMNLSSTSWAQGGIAAVASPDDNFSLHAQDTRVAGDELCDPEIVDIVVTEGPQRVRELIELGVDFDVSKNADSQYDLHQEGGHSKRRIYHAADATGREIQTTLLERAEAHPNIEFKVNYNAIDLITTYKLGIESDKNNRALGAYVLNPKGEVLPIVAGVTMVASGGAGKVYLYTSNPDIASGDGIAMCFRAGAPVANMEFFQFHPTCLFHPKAKSFLITEALRGEGGKLRRQNGEEFMHQYHELKELAPRDVVARAIDFEMKTHGEEHVLLDVSHLPAEHLKSGFPTIYERCLSFGFDITKDPIPVVPAAHYCCGGVITDQNSATNITNLYVSGEAMSSGLHGANRLASNSLLEAVVFSHRAAQHCRENYIKLSREYDIPHWDTGDAIPSDEQVVVTQNWEEIRRCMWNYVGIVRSDKRLERALRRSTLIKREIDEYYWKFLITSDLVELRNLSLVADLVIRSALLRKESRGLHYNIDHPSKDVRYLHRTVIDPEEYFHFTENF
ncbi:MAG: L-aspartate oxidase [Deltaproteobacteria bacterium]|nr:L-aspartate oxidase [Deltaproteobacteria bacterium]